MAWWYCAHNQIVSQKDTHAHIRAFTFIVVVVVVVLIKAKMHFKYSIRNFSLKSTTMNKLENSLQTYRIHFTSELFMSELSNSIFAKCHELVSCCFFFTTKKNPNGYFGVCWSNCVSSLKQTNKQKNTEIERKKRQDERTNEFESQKDWTSECVRRKRTKRSFHLSLIYQLYLLKTNLMNILKFAFLFSMQLASVCSVYTHKHTL